MTTWRKSTYSDDRDNCVELADLGGTIGLRDSKDPTGPVLQLNRGQLAQLLAGIRAGHHDDLT